MKINKVKRERKNSQPKEQKGAQTEGVLKIYKEPFRPSFEDFTPLFGFQPLFTNRLVDIGITTTGGLLEYQGQALQNLEKAEMKQLKETIAKLQAANEQRKIDIENQSKEFESISLLISESISKLKAKKEGAEIKDKRGNIHFNRQTGEVKNKKKTLGELKPGTKHFHMFSTIYDCCPLAINYVSLAQQILESGGKKLQSKSAENYCQTIKSEIKMKAPGIRALIENYRAPDGKPGYRMKSP